jgi:hypothetical protein
MADLFFARIDADTDLKAYFSTMPNGDSDDIDYIQISNGHGDSVHLSLTHLRDLVAAMDRKYGDVK